MTLEDKFEIIEVLGRYSYAIGAKRWEDLDRVFTHDATATYRHIQCHSRDEIKNHVRRHLGGVKACQHLLGNYSIQIDQSTALSVCMLRAWVAGGEGHEGLIREAFGYYHDDLIKTEAGWRIAHRRMELVDERGTTDILRPEAATSPA